jgi:hypothetical protein
VRRLTVPACAACAALLIAACGGSAKHVITRTVTLPAGQSSGQVQSGTATVQRRTMPPPPTPTEIKAAATKTAVEPGFRARLSASIRLPQFNGNPLTARGSGYFDPETSSGTVGVAIELPGLLSLGGPLPTQLRLVGGEAYAQVPSDLAGELPGSATWLQSSISALDLGDSLNPADILREVARDATENVPGQRAHITIDPVTGLVRTIVIDYAVAGGYHVHVRLTLTGFKAQSATVAPPSSDTGSLQSALQSLGF